jgi:hypothetical protein
MKPYFLLDKTFSLNNQRLRIQYYTTKNYNLDNFTKLHHAKMKIKYHHTRHVNSVTRFRRFGDFLEAEANFLDEKFAWKIFGLLKNTFEVSDRL